MLLSGRRLQRISEIDVDESYRYRLVRLDCREFILLQNSLALEHHGVTPKKFTVCWDDGADESIAARRAAELAGAEHHEVRLCHPRF